LVKGAADKHVSMGAVVLGHMPPGLICILLSPAPAPQSYPYIIAGVALHFGYQVFLLTSYRFGDLSQVYPLARGSAPLIVAVASVLWLGTTFSQMEIAAIGVIGLGIISLTLVRREDGLHNGRAAALALATGAFIAAYSLNDGVGARLAGTALGFYGWLAVGSGLVWLIYGGLFQPRSLRVFDPGTRRIFVVGGWASFAAYAIVTWAFTQAPIALVTALRETSIIFALVIGVVLFREPLNLGKLLSTMATMIGVALLRLAR